MEIELCGYKILIDEEDYERIIFENWYINNIKENGDVYFSGFINNKKIKLHRFIINIYDPKIMVDHKNCNTLDNRKINLRACTQNENQRNCRKHKDNRTGFKGIYYQQDAKKYHAQIMVNSKVIYLGLFITPEEAHAAYCEASKKYHGEFGRTE